MIFTASGISLSEFTSLKLFCVKISGSDLQKAGRKNSHKNRKPIPPVAPADLIATKFCFGACFTDIINSTKYHINPFRGFDFVEGQNLAFTLGTRCCR